MNNLDPEVAEKPQERVVYGGVGRAARDWESFDRLVAALVSLEADATLCGQSGKPVGIFRTHEDAPRVLIANSNLVPHSATLDHFNEFDRKGRHGRRAAACGPQAAKESLAAHVRTMLDFWHSGVPTFNYSNNIRQMAKETGVRNAFDCPGFVQAYIRPLF